MGKCPKCDGDKVIRCDLCSGRGKIRNISYIGILSELTGLANDWIKCYRCNGRKTIRCDKCRGTGYYNDD